MSVMDLVTVGLDIAKSMFQLHGTDRLGQPVLRRKLPRSKMLEFFANLPSCRVAWRPVAGHTTGLAS